MAAATQKYTELAWKIVDKGNIKGAQLTYTHQITGSREIWYILDLLYLYFIYSKSLCEEKLLLIENIKWWCLAVNFSRFKSRLKSVFIIFVYKSDF